MFKKYNYGPHYHYLKKQLPRSQLEPYAYTLRGRTLASTEPPATPGAHLALCRLQVQLLPAGGLEVSCSSSHLDPSRSLHYQGPGW